MKFLIITHASHILVNDQVYSYAPYVREMDLWNALSDEVCVVAPVSIAPVTKIDLAYKKNPRVKKISELAFTTLGNGIKSLINLPIIFWILFIEMRRADHIHLRCPGTIGLVGCIVQVLFPKKKKTAKYAGNWGSQSEAAPKLQIAKVDFEQYVFNQEYAGVSLRGMGRTIKKYKIFFHRILLEYGKEPGS